MTIVTTKYGDVQGIREDKYYSFKGIPFAAPPVGELRFRPPVKPAPWQGVRQCTEYGAPCLQLLKKNHVSQKEMLPISSEDCLYLNIKTPEIGQEAKLPVYVFIHGGGFESGGGNMPLYEGEKFAEKGIVYVTINYRLGIFGSYALDTLEKESGCTGHYGILDAARAVEWVYDNIAAFGGDPENITIGGQSAGAFIVSILMCMDSMKGLFKRCIMQSGSIMSSQVRNKYGTGNPEIKKAISRMKAQDLGADDSPEGVAKLRAMPAEDLVLCWEFGAGGYMFGRYGAPVLDNLLFKGDHHPDPRVQPPHDVELLFGFNTDEGTLFAGYSMDENYEDVIKDFFPYDWEKVLAKYPDGYMDTKFDQLSDVIGLKSFKACMIPYADVLAKRGLKVYGYHFDYMTEKLENQGLGCRHIAELNMVFDKYHGVIGADDENGYMTADYMNSAWAGFIKNGNPDSETSGHPVSWKPYDLADRNTLKIRADGFTNVRLEREEELDFFTNVK
ncbi:MAG: carboxylesterase family protein [Firmicutes bacterium]|nr:carboxylesterase family protein [Bacillota bacterium]